MGQEDEKQLETLNELDRRLQQNLKMECRAGQNQQGSIERNSTERKGNAQNTTRLTRHISRPLVSVFVSSNRGRNATSHAALEVALETKPNLLLLSEEVRNSDVSSLNR